MSTDVTGTQDTTNVVGKSGPLADGAALNTYAATLKDTETGVGALTPGGTGGIDNNKAATQPDTSGVAGHTGVLTDGYLFAMTGTVETTRGGGSPIQQANPAYRAPATYDAAVTVKDTTKTDLPISDGTDRDLSPQLISGTFDTRNQVVPLKTTTTNLPVAPTIASVTAGVRSVAVVVNQPGSDPSGAHLTRFRIEYLQVLVDATSGGAIYPHGSLSGVKGYGTAYCPVARNADGSLQPTTAKVVGPEGTGLALTSNESYVFRVAAVNDNGTSAYSAWSSAVTPLNDNAAAGPGHYAAIAATNEADPVYKPDGTVNANQTPGGVASLAAVPGATAGTATVTFKQSVWGAPVSYAVAAIAPNGTVTATGTSTTLSGTVSVGLTGLTPGTAYTIQVTPINANGNGQVRSTTVTATPAPTITTLSPSAGGVGGGTAVTITGTHLTGTSGVTFGGTAATSVVVVNDTTVTCVAPAHASGSVSVVATTPGGTATKTGFVYS